MHTAIFKLFPSVVDPVVQSTNQSFLMRIIAPYTLDTYQIPKLCTWIYLYMLFIWAKFQGNQTTLQRFLQVREKNNLSSTTWCDAPATLVTCTLLCVLIINFKEVEIKTAKGNYMSELQDDVSLSHVNKTQKSVYISNAGYMMCASLKILCINCITRSCKYCISTHFMICGYSYIYVKGQSPEISKTVYIKIKAISVSWYICFLSP